jgi:2-amino-4-hydroxy-6-hydroxymethyldihydropteridine diphosphokinase
MAVTYLLLGSNQGDRQYFLTTAQKQIIAKVGEITQRSGIYETAAWGLEQQASFLNQVLEVTTHLAPADLINQINLIEKELGRERKIRWDARLIDIDILYYDDIILQTNDLTIPHPELHNRRFTLVPLSEITPDFVHPVFKQTNQILLANVPDNLEVREFQG